MDVSWQAQMASMVVLGFGFFLLHNSVQTEGNGARTIGASFLVLSANKKGPVGPPLPSSNAVAAELLEVRRPKPSGNFPNRLQADRGGQAADVLDLGILVEGVSRLVAAIHPDLAFDTQIIGGHEVVAE